MGPHFPMNFSHNPISNFKIFGLKQGRRNYDFRGFSSITDKISPQFFLPGQIKISSKIIYNRELISLFRYFMFYKYTLPVNKNIFEIYFFN